MADLTDPAREVRSVFEAMKQFKGQANETTDSAISRMLGVNRDDWKFSFGQMILRRALDDLEDTIRKELSNNDRLMMVSLASLGNLKKVLGSENTQAHWNEVRRNSIKQEDLTALDFISHIVSVNHIRVLSTKDGVQNTIDKIQSAIEEIEKRDDSDLLLLSICRHLKDIQWLLRVFPALGRTFIIDKLVLLGRLCDLCERKDTGGVRRKGILKYVYGAMVSIFTLFIRGSDVLEAVDVYSEWAPYAELVVKDLSGVPSSLSDEPLKAIEDLRDKKV